MHTLLSIFRRLQSAPATGSLHDSPQQLRRAKKGFTLVELLVVTGITGLLLLTVSSMFMTVLVGRAQSSLRDQVHTEGNEIMGRIEFVVRNSVEADCSGASPVFKTINGANVSFLPGADPTDLAMRFYQDESYITYTDDVLTSDSIVLNDSPTIPDGLQVTCTITPDTNKKSVTIKLDIKHADLETTVSEQFTSIVQIRNS